jgi:uncharacterized surface protein with fasciclin (FAS1) repeats
MARLALALVASLALAATGAHAQTYKTVTEAVKAMPQTSLLGSSVANFSKLATTFDDPDFAGTVFAPTDAAMDELAQATGGGDIASVAESMPEVVEQVLNYHVVPGKALKAAALKNGDRLTTTEGGKLNVTTAGATTWLNDAEVSKANVAAGKAQVHVIDKVLLPPDVAELLGLNSTGPTPAQLAAAKAAAGTATNGTVAKAAAAAVAAAKPAAEAPAASPAPSGAAGAALATAALAAPALLALLF